MTRTIDSLRGSISQLGVIWPDWQASIRLPFSQGQKWRTSMENNSLPNAIPWGRTADTGIPYDSSLFVPRPAGNSTEDAALSTIVNWLQRRLRGLEPKPIFRLEAPPGYGKSWTLSHLVARYRMEWSRRLVCVGPFLPLLVHGDEYRAYDDRWRSQLIDKFLSAPPYDLPKDAFRTNKEAPFQNLIVALCEDIERLAPARHILFIIDETDQARNSLELETKLLDPLARCSVRHPVSLLLAIRSDFGFRTVEELRRESFFERYLMTPFGVKQSRQQLVMLVQSLRQMSKDEAEEFVTRLLASLPHYTWGVPALNAELCSIALGKIGALSKFSWLADDIENCLLRALRLTIPGGGQSADVSQEQDDRQFLLNARRLCSKRPEGWRLEDVRELLGFELDDAARFRNQMQRLNLVERPPSSTYGTYWFLDDWSSILKIWQELAAPAA
jgi:hypothetical protein